MTTLGRLLAPRSVAFVGGDDAAVALTRCRELGFRGRIQADITERKRTEDLLRIQRDLSVYFGETSNLEQLMEHVLVSG